MSWALQGSDDDSEDEADEGPAAMEGMRIRHKAEDLEEGDAVIMTLADRNILDERGELDEDEDILEENLLVCYCLHSCSSLVRDPCCILFFLAECLYQAGYWHVADDAAAQNVSRPWWPHTWLAL